MNYRLYGENGFLASGGAGECKRVGCGDWGWDGGYREIPGKFSENHQVDPVTIRIYVRMHIEDVRFSLRHKTPQNAKCEKS